MYKVALVGHSQIPSNLNVENVEVKIFRAPGGKIARFHRDSRLNKVLLWKHQLTFLWLGSNDITPTTSTGELINQIQMLTREIEEKCGSKVIIIEIERREYPPHKLIVEQEQYKKIRRAVNRALLRSKHFFTITFNAVRFVLASDGVHFEPQSRRQIANQIVENIKKRQAEAEKP